LVVILEIILYLFDFVMIAFLAWIRTKKHLNHFSYAAVCIFGSSIFYAVFSSIMFMFGSNFADAYFGIFGIPIWSTPENLIESATVGAAFGAALGINFAVLILYIRKRAISIILCAIYFAVVSVIAFMFDANLGNNLIGAIIIWAFSEPESIFAAMLVGAGVGVVVGAVFRPLMLLMHRRQ